jgi:prepilin signal peptidase PulO-like enzyme (type II secretory pathway)
VVVFYSFIIFVLGLLVGSFLANYTYRAPRGKSVFKGRSNCPKCKKKIAWYDNIPLVSFILLRAKCRSCGKSISPRYFIIELATGLGFFGIFLISCKCMGGLTSYDWIKSLGILSPPFLLLIFSILLSIFVIDFEHQIIPDELVNIAFVLIFVVLLFSSKDTFFAHLASAFLASVFLLLLHLITQGRGMGLGDVKFALVGGILLGWPATMYWMFLSFVIGAVAGIILISFGKAKFGKHIAFGPFLVIALVITFVYGDLLGKLFLF